MPNIKKNKLKISASKVKFINNEPAKIIPGGSKRESTVVAPRKYPEIARRRRLNSILLNHCASAKMLDLLKPTDLTLLQRIAQETVISGVNPIIRKKAIWALNRFPEVSTINILADLAESGEDEYIKSYALRSLGAIGVGLAVPLLINGLKDKSDLINQAAKKAIVQTADKIGPSPFTAALRLERDMKVQKTVNSLLKEGQKVIRKTKKTSMREVKAD